MPECFARISRLRRVWCVACNQHTMGKNRIANEPQIINVEWVMSAAPLQQASLFAARGFRHDAFSPCPLLSVKCMFNGSALYRADHSWFSVNETGYLVLNDQQPYEIHI